MLSPTSREVRFKYSAEFQTRSAKPTQELITRHAQYLFGYMQSPQLVADYRINHRIPGIGAPAWPPAFTVLDEVSEENGTRTISYSVNGVMLLNSLVADPWLNEGKYRVYLPYDFDNYYVFECSEWGHENSEYGFWYFYNPFHEGCEKLIQAPLARPVDLRISELKDDKAEKNIPFKELRGDNGNGELFQITTINGFDEKGGRNDNGRVAYKDINDWLSDQGFEKTIVSRFEKRPIYQFDKMVKGSDGQQVHLRVTRLLADTDLDEKRVTFAKFYKEATRSADVIIYAGHSGSGAALDVKDIEDKAGPLEYDREKQQLFFFDACSGYSYYLGLFTGQKNPGRLHVLSFGLSSEFGYEHAMHKTLLRALFNMKDDSQHWNDLMSDMERPLRGQTFMLNVSGN